jgi:hypothetical protein
MRRNQDENPNIRTRWCEKQRVQGKYACDASKHEGSEMSLILDGK